MLSGSGNVTAMLLNEKEWEMLANIMTFYLRNTPEGAAPAQRALAERIKDAATP